MNNIELGHHTIHTCVDPKFSRLRCIDNKQPGSVLFFMQPVISLSRETMNGEREMI